MATAKKWKRRTFNGSNMSRALNLTDKRRIEQTVWWNNYRMYNQWQQNALAWTWHVAWIPTQQAPQMTLNAPMSTAWNTETTTPANNTQGTTTPVTAAPRVTSSRPRTTSAQPWNSGPQMRNANLNLWAYGDDSSRENYDDPSEWWGQNPKYEWEWVKNTFIGYDPNATIEGLDPNYKFWWDAQLANSADANYIARRNDQIASALYNAWVRDSVQVADFLNSMEWFQNSNSNERHNTVVSIWKRIWDMAQEAEQEPQAPEEERPAFWDEWNNEWWLIYGRASGDKNTTINTVADPYSVDATVQQARQTNYTSLQTMDPYNVAMSITNGIQPYWSQAMRDLQQYDPERYAQIKENINQINWQNTANEIATSWTIQANKVTQTETTAVNNDVDTRAWGITSSPLLASQTATLLGQNMASNQVANSATQEMLNINKDIAEWQKKIDNLAQEAKAAFKWDVPQYIYEAYMNNRSQKYQDEIDKLQSRYDAAMDLYKTELDMAKWQMEMDLKERQFKQQISNDLWDREYKMKALKQNNIKWVDGKAYMVNDDWTVSQLTDTTAYNNYMQSVNSALQWYASIYPVGSQWWQCESFTDNFTEATTWLRMTWEWGRWWTTAEEKIWYINTMTPTVWSVAVGVWWAYNKTYWHTMLVTWYDPETWIIDLLRSNKDWEEQVHETHTTLDKLFASGVKGFWNPYLDLMASSGGMWVDGATWPYNYSFFNTPMAATFERISASADTATQQALVANTVEMYDTLYKIVNDNSLNALIENGDLALILKWIKTSKFWSWDKEAGSGSSFASQFYDTLVNKANKLAWWDESYKALMNLYRLVEIKLRKESWAAITSSEWMSNFQYLLPQPWESIWVRESKLEIRDQIISSMWLSAWMRMSEYVPIFNTSSVREIRGY